MTTLTIALTSMRLYLYNTKLPVFQWDTFFRDKTVCRFAFILFDLPWPFVVSHPSGLMAEILSMQDGRGGLEVFSTQNELVPKVIPMVILILTRVAIQLRFWVFDLSLFIFVL